MRLHRSALAGIALGALLPMSAAEAATGVSAAGSATSSATLVTLSVGALLDVVPATSVKLGTLKATTSSGKTPAVSFTAATINGTKHGAITVSPSNSPQTVGGAALTNLGVISVKTPAATLKAVDGAVKSATADVSLGEASILGLPITLQGGVSAGSATDVSQAKAAKTLKIENIALPNVADLLAALGIDITNLPVGTLNALVDDLRLTLSSAAQTAFDNANLAVDSAGQALEDGQDAVATAQTAYDTAEAALDAALAPVTVPELVTLPDGVAAPLDHADWDMLSADVKSALITANSVASPGLAEAATNYEAAKGPLATAQGAIAGLQSALDSALDTLAGVVDGVLAGVPLVEIGAAEIGTKAIVNKTKTADVTGSISGVKVLGTDILAELTGDSELDVAEIAGDLAHEINDTIAAISATLSGALSEVTGATGLVVPTPDIKLMVEETATGVDGAFGTANTMLTALSVSIGSVSVPDAFALTDAAALPGLAAITGGFETAPLSMKVGSITEAARYRPASAAPATPTTGNTGTHPSTGGPAGLAIVAVIGAALAVGVRRRLRAGTE